MPDVYLASRLDYLRRAQNPDGGWGYFPGKQSWIEPTAYAALALQHTPEADHAWQLIQSWRRPDGSYRPCTSVRDGTWVTALALLVASERGEKSQQLEQSVHWLVGVRGAESGLLMRAAAHFHLIDVEFDLTHTGWPWREGNASWVEPTSHTLVALKKASQAYTGGTRSSAIRRIQEGETMLLSRRCTDGGWNCGNPNVLTYQLPSYPETTAVALLGLQGSTLPDAVAAVAKGRSLLEMDQSSLAKAWLTIALRIHGIHLPAPAENDPTGHDHLLTALEALAHPAGNFAAFRTEGSL